MDFAWVDFGQRARQEVRLLLVIALQHHTVARNDQGFKNLDQTCGWDDATIGDRLDQINPALLFFLTSVPDGGLFTCLTHVYSFVFVQQKECRFSHERVQSSNARLRYAKRNVFILSEDDLRRRASALRQVSPVRRANTAYRRECKNIGIALACTQERQTNCLAHPITRL